MQVEEKGGNLIITIPKNVKPIVSATGKTLQIATSHGNMPTSVLVDGQAVSVGVNAFIKNPKYVKPTA